MVTSTSVSTAKETCSGSPPDELCRYERLMEHDRVRALRAGTASDVMTE